MTQFASKTASYESFLRQNVEKEDKKSFRAPKLLQGGHLLKKSGKKLNTSILCAVNDMNDMNGSRARHTFLFRELLPPISVVLRFPVYASHI